MAIKSKRAVEADPDYFLDRVKRIMGEDVLIEKQVWETEGGAITPEEEEVLRRTTRRVADPCDIDINFFEIEYDF